MLTEESKDSQPSVEEVKKRESEHKIKSSRLARQISHNSEAISDKIRQITEKQKEESKLDQRRRSIDNLNLLSSVRMKESNKNLVKVDIESEVSGQD